MKASSPKQLVLLLLTLVCLLGQTVAAAVPCEMPNNIKNKHSSVLVMNEMANIDCHEVMKNTTDKQCQSDCQCCSSICSSPAIISTFNSVSQHKNFKVAELNVRLVSLPLQSLYRPPIIS